MTFVQSIGENCHVGKDFFKTHFMYDSVCPVQVKPERSKTIFFCEGGTNLLKKQTLKTRSCI